MVVAGGVYGWNIVYVFSNCPRIDSPVIPTILCVGYSYSYLADNCSMCVLDIGLSFYSNFTPFIHVFLG